MDRKIDEVLDKVGMKVWRFKNFTNWWRTTTSLLSSAVSTIPELILAENLPVPDPQPAKLSKF
jgi:hypothetical protein